MRVRTSILKRSLPILLAISVHLGCMPLTALGQNIEPDTQEAAIEDMLAAGSYVEGEVIAAIRTDGEQMEIESDDAYEVTELISVDSIAVQQVVGDESVGEQSAGEHTARFESVEDESAQQTAENSSRNSSVSSGYSVEAATPLSDNVNLCVISSDTMSTEELLRELADDANVVFAEPNYLIEMDSDDYSGDLTSESQLRPDTGTEGQNPEGRAAASEEREDREGQENRGGRKNREEQEDREGQEDSREPEDPNADGSAQEGKETPEDHVGGESAPEGGGLTPEDQQDPAGGESSPGEQQYNEEQEKLVDDELPPGEQENPEEQEIPEDGELPPEVPQDQEGFGIVPEIPEGSNRALGAQPEPGPLGDLTPLQWGNRADDLTVRADGAAANPSINVPNFGASGSAVAAGAGGSGAAGGAGNMDKQIVVALIDTGVYTEHPDLDDVVYHFTPKQQEALGCWEKGYNAVGKGMYGNVRDEASISHGHGTHTAGIIGAEWNGFGTSGVASNVRIVCIELADADGKESLADALAAFGFVDRFNEQASEEERIRVTSNSWSEYMSSKALDAVLRSLGERWGTVSVFSAGNDGKNNENTVVARGQSLCDRRGQLDPGRTAL